MAATSHTASHQQSGVPLLITNEDDQDKDQSPPQQIAATSAMTNSMEELQVSQEVSRVENSNQVDPRQSDNEELENARSDVRYLYARVQELEGALEKLEKLEKQNHQLRISMKEVLDKYDQSENDNVVLRSRIVSMRAPPGQVNDDGYYVQKLNWLNETTQVWAAGAYKGRCNHDLGASAEAELERILDCFQSGKALLQMMRESRYTIREIHQNPSQRIALVRHLFALFLSAHVFRPLCMGISEECNAVMMNAINNIALKEKEFSKVLMIRQALGQGVLQQFKPIQNEIRDELINELENTVKLLLPKPQDIKPKLVKIVDGAIELANEMTCEQALFKCKIFASGETFMDKFMYVPDDNQRGRVYICTFPLFIKRIYHDGRASWGGRLQPASVELESAFRQHVRS